MSVALSQCTNHGEGQTAVGLFGIDDQTSQLEPARPEPRKVPLGIRIVQPRNVLKQKRFFNLAEECAELGGRITCLDVPRLLNMAPT